MPAALGRLSDLVTTRAKAGPQHVMFSTHLSLSAAGVIAFVIAVAVVDLATHRIPNWLTAPAAAVGMLASVAATGASGALTSAAGLLVGLVAFLPFYLARGFGAGDVKAMAAIGAFVGPQGALLAAAAALVAGGFGAVLVLFSTGGYPALRAIAQRFTTWAGLSLASGRVLSLGPPATPTAARRFPYGLAIACGTIASIAWS